MVPTELRANFDLTFEVEDKASSVPTGYTPKFVLGGAASLVKAGTVVGSNLSFSLLATETVNLATGQYWYQVIAQNGSGGRRFIADGTIWVDAQLTGTGTFDGRSVPEKVLEAIDAAMLGKATKDQQSYVIQSGSGSRSLSRLSIAELMEARKFYASIVSTAKRLRNDQSLFKRHKFTFVAD